MGEEVMSERPIDADLAESMAHQIYKPCPCGPRYPNGWARLTINMSLLTEEEREKVYEAQRLLSEVGVTFDTGSGGGGRDWELDWSLTGALVRVRPLYCMGEHKERVELREGTVYWATWRRPEARHTLTWPFCSPECRSKALAERDAIVLMLDEAQVGE